MSRIMEKRMQAMPKKVRAESASFKTKIPMTTLVSGSKVLKREAFWAPQIAVPR